MNRKDYQFQFHIGTIKSARAELSAIWNFNSTLVRLKAYTSSTTATVIKFQFHIGLIKRATFLTT